MQQSQLYSSKIKVGLTGLLRTATPPPPHLLKADNLITVVRISEKM